MAIAAQFKNTAPLLKKVRQSVSLLLALVLIAIILRHISWAEIRFALRVVNFSHLPNQGSTP